MSTPNLPTTEQLNQFREELKNEVSNLEQQHKLYKEQEQKYQTDGSPQMAEAMNSCAANIWNTRCIVANILSSFKNIYPEPTE